MDRTGSLVLCQIITFIYVERFLILSEERNPF